MALEALQKVLAVDEHNVDAMYLTALYQLQRGNTQQADIWRKKMAEIAPQDPRLSALNSANSMQSISPSQLNAARNWHSTGKPKRRLQPIARCLKATRRMNSRWSITRRWRATAPHGQKGWPPCVSA